MSMFDPQEKEKLEEEKEKKSSESTTPVAGGSATSTPREQKKYVRKRYAKIASFKARGICVIKARENPRGWF